MPSVSFKATLHKFEKQGEKTGWTYIEVPAAYAEKIKAGTRTGFRVKGKLDRFPIAGAYLQPMGAGNFILPINAEMRKGIAKKHGAMITVQLQEDSQPFVFNKDFVDCLADEPRAQQFFGTLPGSHQRYFSKWIDSAKTEVTKAKRIAQAVSALARSKKFQDMLRNLKEEKNRLGE